MTREDKIKELMLTFLKGYNKMTREDKIKELMSKEDYKGWSEEDIAEEIQDIPDELLDKGYAISDFDGTGMLEIQKLDVLYTFKNDKEAVSQAIKDGIKIIPVDELPQNFDRRYLGWIDTKENRQAIEEYCEKSQTEERE